MDLPTSGKLSCHASRKNAKDNGRYIRALEQQWGINFLKLLA